MSALRPIAGLDTHEVVNQPPPLENMNLFTGDRGLSDAVVSAGGGGHIERLTALGARCGSAEVIGWGALSGLTVDPADPAVLFAVSDSVYKDQPAIYRIQTGTTPARITQKITVTEGGKPAAGLDLEGIAADGQGGFWLASEGNAEKGLTHRILHVNGAGAVLAQVELPTELTAGATRFGLEGIARAADGTLWMAVQREWKDDPKGQVKLLRHDPATGEWSAVRYPLEAGEGWVGLSEIAIHKDRLYLIERDNLIGDKARLKQVTSVALDGLRPAALGGDLPLVDKQVVRDLIPDLKRWNGYVQDKVEGMAISPDGTVWVAVSYTHLTLPTNREV